MGSIGGGAKGVDDIMGLIEVIGLTEGIEHDARLPTGAPLIGLMPLMDSTCGILPTDRSPPVGTEMEVWRVMLLTGGVPWPDIAIIVLEGCVDTVGVGLYCINTCLGL